MKKKILLISTLFLLISCGYYKDSKIYKPITESNSYYIIKVFKHDITNSGAVMLYKIPMKGITDQKVDSINKLADMYITKCEKYTQN